MLKKITAKEIEIIHLMLRIVAIHAGRDCVVYCIRTTFDGRNDVIDGEELTAFHSAIVADRIAKFDHEPTKFFATAAH